MSTQRAVLSSLFRGGSRLVSVPHPSATQQDEPAPAPPWLERVPVLSRLNSHLWMPPLSHPADLLSPTIPFPTHPPCVSVSSQTEELSPKSVDGHKWEVERNMAHVLLSSNQYAQAVEKLRRAADVGNVEAIVDLAEMVYDGVGVVRDAHLALELWDTASRAGHAGAMYQAAAVRLDLGLIKPELAVKEMRRAAHSGSCDAAFYLVVNAFFNGKPSDATGYISIAIKEDKYRHEMLSWVNDDCIDEHCAALVRSTLAAQSAPSRVQLAP